MTEPAVIAVLIALALCGYWAVWAADVLSRLPEVMPVRRYKIEANDTLHLPDGGCYVVVRTRGNEVRVRFRKGRVRLLEWWDADAWLHLVWLAERNWPAEDDLPTPELGGEG